MLTYADGAGTPSWVRFLVYVIAGTILIVLQVHEAPTVPGCALPGPPPPRPPASLFFILFFIFYFYFLFYFLFLLLFIHYFFLSWTRQVGDGNLSSSELGFVPDSGFLAGQSRRRRGGPPSSRFVILFF